MITAIGKHVRSLPCMSRLRDEELLSFCRFISLKKVDKNCVIFEESDTAEIFYIVKTGLVKLYRTSPGGRELLMKAIGPGECIVCSPLYGTKGHVVSAGTLEASTLVAIPAQKFKEMMSNNVDKIGLYVIECLSSRIEHLSALLSDLAFRDVEERVVISLMRLAAVQAPENTLASLTLTHSDIASMTGTVREVVSRTMSKLKRDGVIIDSNVRGFRIDRERLARLVSGK